MTAIQLKCFCFNCNTLQATPIGIEGVCEKCEAEQTWFKKDVYTVEPLQIHPQHSVKITANGVMVNGQVVER
jgi:hypothetical protein